jgi:hypothetical protein
MEQIITLDNGGAIYCRHFEAGRPLTNIDNPSATLFSSEGREVYHQAGLTVDAEGKMIISVPRGVFHRQQDWCRAEFSYQVDGCQYSQNVTFHVASQVFEIPFFYEDLITQAPFLKERAAAEDPRFESSRIAVRSAVYNRIANAGRAPWKLANLSALTVAAKYLWLATICQQFSVNPDDLWSSRYRDYLSQFEAEFARCNLAERTEDGLHEEGSGQPIARTRLRRA